MTIDSLISSTQLGTLVGVYVGGLPHRVGPVSAPGRVPHSNSRIGGTAPIGSILCNRTVSGQCTTIIIGYSGPA